MATVSMRCLTFFKLTADKTNRFARIAYIAYFSRLTSTNIVYIAHIALRILRILRCVFYNKPKESTFYQHKQILCTPGTCFLYSYTSPTPFSPW